MAHPLNEELLAGAVRADMMHEACVMTIFAELLGRKARTKALRYLLGLYSPTEDDCKRARVEVNPFTGRLRFVGRD